MELKKNPKKDYRKHYALFFNIGLVISLAMVISAFELKFSEIVSNVDLSDNSFIEEPTLVPITEHKPPEKPPVRQIEVLKIVDDEVEVPDIKIEIDIMETDEIDDLVEYIDPIDDEEVDVIEVIVEKMPSFEGGLTAFYKFVGDNLKYPAQARRIGIEGKVFVNFVVDKDGSLSEIKVVKGIGAGCDEEVERIIALSPKWNPGKQRGNPVRVRMMMPITFRLD